MASTFVLFGAAPVYAFFGGRFWGIFGLCRRGFFGGARPPRTFLGVNLLPQSPPLFLKKGIFSIFLEIFPSGKGFFQIVGVETGVFFEFFGLMS